MDDDDTVFRRMHVELDGIGATFEGPPKGSHGVLVELEFCAAVGDALQGLGSLGRGILSPREDSAARERPNSDMSSV